MIATAQRPAIEFQRLVRAIEIIRKEWIERIDDSRTQFRVLGHEEPEYYIDLEEDVPCYCLDMQHSPRRIRQCKHILAGRLMNYDPAVFEHMVDVIEREERRKREARER